MLLHPSRPLALLLASILCASPIAIVAETSAPSTPAAAATPSDPAARLAWLRAELARHDALYFQHAAPEISDLAYDQLKREFLSLTALHPDVAATLPPLPSAGDDRNGLLPTHAHLRPMRGLAKVNTPDELRAFLRSAETILAKSSVSASWIIEPKYDGLAFNALYENGRLIRVLTRGNGLVGDDITAQVRASHAMPEQLKSTPAAPPPARIELRGELYLTLAEFTRLNLARTQAGQPAFAHPRNLAVGTAKHTDLAEVARRSLSAVVYGFGEITAHPSSPLPETHQAFLALVASWGLPTPTHSHSANATDALLATVNSLGDQRHAWPMPTDGLVIKLNYIPARALLGENDQGPLWAIAYKFTTERLSTRLRAITYQVGRTGALTPVAELDPLTLGGATITRATLHNSAHLRRLDLRLGDYVFVEKAGEIIPAIIGIDLEKRNQNSTTLSPPTRCPACSTPLGETPDTCPNFACPARLRARLLHFVSPAGVGIKGLGEATADALLASGRCQTLADLYRLRREDLLALPGIGEKTADKLLAEIEKSRRVPAPRLLAALSLEGIGPKSAQKLAAALPDLAALTQLDDATRLAETTGLTVTQANALLRSLKDSYTRAELLDLIAVGISPPGFAAPTK